MRFSKVVFTLIFVISPAISVAEELGPIGNTYPIAEENAVDMIMRKLREKEKSGELKRIQEESIKRSLNSVKNIKPVDGLVTVQVRSSRLFDPTITYPNTVTTDDGRVVVPAGTKINPLEMASFTKTLIFFDGRDKAQSEAVRKLVAKGLGRVKPILVAGSWLDLTKAWKTQVYFDQKGTLSARFGLKAVPSVIRQQGKYLLLEEIPAKELK